MFKKNIIILLAVVSVGLILGAFGVKAAPTNINELANPIATQAGYDVKQTTETTMSEMIGSIVKAFLTLAGTIFLIIIFWAGFLWMTASGNEDQVSDAQSKVKMAVIGLVVVLAAYSITAIILVATNPPKMQVGGTSNGFGNFWGSLWGDIKDTWNSWWD